MHSRHCVCGGGTPEKNTHSPLNGSTMGGIKKGARGEKIKETHPPTHTYTLFIIIITILGFQKINKQRNQAIYLQTH